MRNGNILAFPTSIDKIYIITINVLLNIFNFSVSCFVFIFFPHNSKLLIVISLISHGSNVSAKLLVGIDPRGY